jgi:ABC-type Mn2+/Zn2+ transport system ATPase subunit
MNMNVVEASGLGKRYGSTWALRDCSLAIPAGHVAALVGPNGAGKSTLLSLAVGLATPSAAGRRGPRLRLTASRSSRRTCRCTRTCPPRTCCT